MIIDHFNRQIDYVRISITDRCNLRCKYCMPEEIPFVPHERILRYEEIVYIVKVLADLGIRKVKVTGGEPLVRCSCADLIQQIHEINGIDMVTLTTNGVLLKEQLPTLQAAGLDAINVSLDTLQRKRYQEMTGKDVFEQVMEGIHAAYDSGIPLKINCVPLDGENTEELPAFFEWARQKNVAVRFIEMMPIGYGNIYKSYPIEEIRKEFFARYPEAYPINKKIGNGPAVYYSAPGFAGEVGVIGAVHEKFCSGCNRIRLTSEGFLKLCLYSREGVDLRSMIRSGCTDEELAQTIGQAITRKPKEHHFGDHIDADTRKMSQIGG